jgi:hypothetical protein
MTDGRLVHLIFNGSDFTLCNLATDAMREAGDPTPEVPEMRRTRRDHRTAGVDPKPQARGIGPCRACPSEPYKA